MKQCCINYGLGLSVCLVFTYLAIQYLGAHAVVVVVFWGAILAKPIVLGALWLFRYIRQAPLRPYQGQYYAFHHYPVHVVEFEAALWIVDTDILPIIGLSVNLMSRRFADAKQYRYFKHNNTWAFAEDYINQIVMRSQHPEAHALCKWLHQVVYFPYQQKRRTPTSLDNTHLPQ